MSQKPYDEDDPNELIGVALPEGDIEETAKAL